MQLEDESFVAWNRGNPAAGTYESEIEIAKELWIIIRPISTVFNVDA